MPSPGGTVIAGPMQDWVTHLADAKGLSPGLVMAAAAASGSVWERVRHLLYTEANHTCCRQASCMPVCRLRRQELLYYNESAFFFSKKIALCSLVSLSRSVIRLFFF